MSKIHCQKCPSFNKCAFHLLNESEVDMLNELKQTKSYKRGDFLNIKGQPADGLYCLQSGFAKIVWPDKNFSKESIVKIAGSGDYTGYRCLFSEEKFRATAVVLSDLEACFIPKEYFLELLEKNPKFNFEILSRMGKEIKRAEERLHSFCAKNVRERLAECLLYLESICGVASVNNETILEIKLSRDELSSLIGTAKETVVRALTDMKEEKIISQNENYLIILNRNGLEKIAYNSHQ